MVMTFYYYCFYFLVIFSSIRFFLHTGVLAFPIPEPVTYKRVKNNKKILIQYPIRNEPIEIIERFFKSLWTIPETERYRFLLQVLDDYDTEMTTRFNSPISTVYLKRPKREGNKAGNLNYGLSKTSSKEYKFVAIFDCDHQIDGKGLIEAAEILEGNRNICCVQSRWVFDNIRDTFLSFLQEHFMGVHIEREQTWRSRYNIYPIFNGAGGLWNREIVEKECGGWLTRCVCEDTDISGVLNMRNYQIHVLPTWVTRIDLVEDWDSFQKQQARWIKGNGQQLQYHLRDPNGWGWKKLYWLSWNIGFGLAPFKYVMPFFYLHKHFLLGLEFNLVDKITLIPHLFAWVAAGQTWDNKICWKRILSYPLHYFIEIGVLHHQIEGFWTGYLNWRSHIEFDVTPKGMTAKIIRNEQSK